MSGSPRRRRLGKQLKQHGSFGFSMQAVVPCASTLCAGAPLAGMIDVEALSAVDDRAVVLVGDIMTATSESGRRKSARCCEQRRVDAVEHRDAERPASGSVDRIVWYGSGSTRKR